MSNPFYHKMTGSQRRAVAKIFQPPGRSPGIRGTDLPWNRRQSNDAFNRKQSTAEFFGKEAEEFIYAEMDKRLRMLGAKALEIMQEFVSTPFPPASRPGELPHLRTGEFRDSMFWEIDTNLHEVRIGTNLPKAKELELGTVKMKPRPWLTLLTNHLRMRLWDLGSVGSGVFAVPPSPRPGANLASMLGGVQLDWSSKTRW